MLLTSRERVLTTLNHREPDRVPIDLGATSATGIAAGAYSRLRQRLGLPCADIRIYEVFSMVAMVEPDVMDRFGVDVVLVPALAPRFGIPLRDWKPWRLFDGTIVQVPGAFQTVEEPDGSILLWVNDRPVGKMPRDGHYFSELANTAMGDLLNMAEPPDPKTVHYPLLSEEDLRFRQRAARALYEGTDKALVVDLVENLKWTPSIPQWLFGLAAWPEETAALHQKRAEALLANVKLLFEAVGPYVQVFAIYQDVGTQEAEVMSPGTFRGLVAPYYKQIFDWVHQNTPWKVFFHSCGSIYRLIPDMIAMGVDILNPVQTSAAHMDPLCLKAEFGDRLTFWGGGVDTQTVLPFGTTETVRDQVQERISTLAPGGGYIFAPTQDIQDDVPVENILAMYEAARQAGVYTAA